MTHARHVLIVDDEPSICWALEKMLTQEGHDVSIASSAEDGLRLVATRRPDLIFLDVRLPGEDGLSALPRFTAATDHAPVIIITAFGDLDTAVAAVRQGAADYLTKPFGLDDALRTCRLAMSRPDDDLREQELHEQVIAPRLVGRSAGMQVVFRQIALAASSDLSVLITGETGTGKELVAAALHQHGRRADQPYLPVAPVTLNPDVIESELFGHVRGAFTGASADREGLFERASGGTVFLDEIGDLPLAAQVKLLRVLEQGQYSRVGDVAVRVADVRIIAATNCDLHRSVRAGTFREDLFHRLSAVQIHLPPLRERLDDLPELCSHFLAQMRYPSPSTAIDDRLVEVLSQRPWHGNIRELRAAIQHASVIARGRQLAIEDFPAPKPSRDANEPDGDGDGDGPTLDQVVRRWTLDALESSRPNDGTLQERFLAACQPALLRTVLQHTGGNRAKAAEVLGIHRGTLRDRLRSHAIEGQADSKS